MGSERTASVRVLLFLSRDGRGSRPQPATAEPTCAGEGFPPDPIRIVASSDRAGNRRLLRGGTKAGAAPSRSGCSVRLDLVIKRGPFSHAVVRPTPRSPASQLDAFAARGADPLRRAVSGMDPVIRSSLKQAGGILLSLVPLFALRSGLSRSKDR